MIQNTRQEKEEEEEEEEAVLRTGMQDDGLGTRWESTIALERERERGAFEARAGHVRAPHASRRAWHVERKTHATMVMDDTLVGSHFVRVKRKRERQVKAFPSSRERSNGGGGRWLREGVTSPNASIWNSVIAGKHEPDETSGSNSEWRRTNWVQAEVRHGELKP
ncbi:hypothetical protein MUK42_35387 [Musa troglodytarum]|uniref:Uncharacterized protein n=1 Tax=Musa troglodytarum TaxID=320322 RepID=A0A9E7FK52_9LILI|nr:hypothetical protein MUK42_35387 [Musa troglodytarum]